MRALKPGAVDLAAWCPRESVKGDVRDTVNGVWERRRKVTGGVKDMHTKNHFGILALKVQIPRRIIARRVRHGVEPVPHLPARPFARYKDALVPRRFSSTSLPPFFPFNLRLPAPPPQSCLWPHRAPLTPCRPLLPPQNRNDAASRNNAAARPAGSYSLDALVTLSSRPSDPCVSPCAMTLVKRPAFQQVAGDLVTRRP